MLVVVWLVLYLPHLRNCPGWYGDETIALTAAQDLMRGNVAQRAMWNSFWHPYAPYQPGYLYLMGLASTLTGGDILGPRFLNTLFALATALLIAFHGRAILGILPSLFAALLFLSYEQTVLHFRWIFTHNLVAFGFTL
jgi:4-amino-4-deoxy-L-arabinose transferase-like glycosyltransferase